MARWVRDSEATAYSCASHIVVFEWLRGGPLAEWATLPTASSPPVFATQLAPLVIRQHPQYIALLPLLLACMHSSLTLVDVGVQVLRHAVAIASCAECNAAVQAVRAAVGAERMRRGGALFNNPAGLIMEQHLRSVASITVWSLVS